MAIIVSQRGGKASVVQQAGIDREDQLEKYVAENPHSLPVNDIKEDARLMVIARQFPTNSGEIDVLAIDSDGDIYIVETKLYKNPDKRLVVAQVLDYGASLWRAYSDPATFVSKLDGLLIAQKRGALAHAVAEFFKLNEVETDSIIENVKKNLQTGNIRFLVLMNRLHDPLKDLILFLNQRSGFHIYAVEMEFYRHQDLEIVIPKLFGNETVKTAGDGGGGAGRKWNEANFLEDARKQLSDIQMAALRKLYEFSAREGKVAWGTSKKYGSFSAKFPPYDDTTVYYVTSDGALSLCAIWQPSHGQENREYMDERRKALERIGFDIERSGHQRYGWPDFVDVPADAWVPRVDQLIDVIRGLLQEG